MLASTDQLARDYIKSHAETVEDVMTRDVVSVVDTTPVADIAILLETRGIKRVPVLRAGKLVGIVSRANLIHALAMAVTEPIPGFDNDLAIREKLHAELKAQRWAEVAPANVTVKSGVVHLWNSYVSEVEKQALLTLVSAAFRECTPSKTICGRWDSYMRDVGSQTEYRFFRVRHRLPGRTNPALTEGAHVAI
jgi:CBS domain-containing protein